MKLQIEISIHRDYLMNQISAKRKIRTELSAHLKFKLVMRWTKSFPKSGCVDYHLLQAHHQKER